MKFDSAIVVARSNKRSRTGTIRLPAESSRFGPVLDCQPKNMVEIELPVEQYQRWKNQVYQVADESDHQKLFRKSWDVLYKMGFGNSGKRVVETKPEDPEKTDDPASMSWRRYCAWRQEVEERRRGKKKPFQFAPPKQKS